MAEDCKDTSLIVNVAVRVLVCLLIRVAVLHHDYHEVCIG